MRAAMCIKDGRALLRGKPARGEVVSFELGKGEVLSWEDEIAIEIETAPYRLNKEIRNIRKREEILTSPFQFS